MQITALIVAAGAGTRLAGGRPKAFLDLGGKPLMSWSLAAFDAHPAVTAIVLLVPPAHLAEARDIARPFGKVAAVEPGGERRQDTVTLGLSRVREGLVLVHDAARPFVSGALIDRVIEAAARSGAAIPGIPPVDTVRAVAAGRAAQVLDRSQLVLVQTPQGFRADLLARACAGSPPEVTDDAALVQRLGEPVEVVAGDTENFKVTTPADLDRARRVAAERTSR